MLSDTDLSHQPDSFKPFKPLTLLTAILLSALVAGTGGYLLGRRNAQSISILAPIPTPTPQLRLITQPSPISIPSSIPVAAISPSTDAMSWKRYTNTQQKYSLQYPQNWSVFPDTVGGVIQGYNGTIITSTDKFDPHGETFAENGQAGIVITVIGIDKSPNETLLAYQRRRLPAPNGSHNYYVQTTLNGRDVLKHIMTVEEVNAGQPVYIMSNGSLVYWIGVSVYNSNYMKTVYQILSTFTFQD